MIEARGLTKRYGSTLAVDDLSFTVGAGSVTGFLGPNGAGKSTTMRMLLGLDRPTSGHALINGRPFTASSQPMREVGALLEAKAAHPGLRVRDHLRALSLSNGLPRSRVDAVLTLTGMQDVGGRRVRGLSLGMSQRLGLAAAMLGDPQVLLFDEPVNGLDPEGIQWVRNFMKALAREGRAVLVSSHLMSEMALTADHLLVIGRGKLIADTGMQEFIRQSGGRVRARSPQQTELAAVLAGAGHPVAVVDGALELEGVGAAEVGDLAFRAGLPLHELTEVQASLEEAFMALTASSVEFHAAAPPAPPRPPAPPAPPLPPTPPAASA